MAAARRVTLIRAVLRLACAGAALFGLTACRDLERFDTEKPAAYCGAIVGSFSTGFIQNGAPPSLELSLQIDTSSLTAHPGSLSSNDATTGFCAPSPLFDAAPLRAIPAMLHDALSQADLGQGHEHDFFAWVDSTCQGTMVAVVSLLTNGAVEVRLLKPALDMPEVPGQAQDQSKTAGFALFYLQRNNGGCGF